MLPASSFHGTCSFPLGEGAVLFRAAIGKLAVLNGSGNLVWQGLSKGENRAAVAVDLAECFGLGFDEADRDVAALQAALRQAGFLGEPPQASRPVSTPALALDSATDCGTFRFGNRCMAVRSSVPGINAAYFSRFHHRAALDADALLEFQADATGFALTLNGEDLHRSESITGLLGRFHEQVLEWEYPGVELIAYVHAAALRRGRRTLLLPGNSGVGKSTLAGYLAAHGCAYLGDDVIAMAADGTLWPAPTCLSLKSGAWPIFAALYPELADLPTRQSRVRELRHVALESIGGRQPPPAAIVFPAYSPGRALSLAPLSPPESMARLIECDLALSQPNTDAKVAAMVRLVERTPAYAMSHADLAEASAALGALLDELG